MCRWKNTERFSLVCQETKNGSNKGTDAWGAQLVIGMFTGNRGDLRFAEGKVKSSGNFGPEFAKHVVTGVRGDGDADALRVGSNSALIVGHVSVAENGGAGGAEPFREIEHA